MRTLVVVASCLLFLIGGISPVALAGDTTCVGAISGTHDNVVVPPGAMCVVSAGTQILGSIKNYGDLAVFGPGTNIRGNLNSEPGSTDTDLISMPGSNGIMVSNVQIKGSAGGAALIFVQGVFMRGDFQYEENSESLNMVGNTVSGNVKLEKNLGGGLVSENTIGGNIECKENTPPILETGNNIGGSDKCPE